MPESPDIVRVSSTPEEFRKSMGVIPPGGGGELGALVSEDSSDWERGGKQEFLKLLYHFTFWAKDVLAIRGACSRCCPVVGFFSTSRSSLQS